MRGDFKAMIVRLHEAEGLHPLEISERIGCDLDYARMVLRVHRGHEDPRSVLNDREAHSEHLMSLTQALPPGRGFPVLNIPPSYRVRA